MERSSKQENLKLFKIKIHEENKMNRGRYKETREMTLKQYKRHKVSLLKQLGKRVDVSVFEEATTEVQVDNIAHSIIMA